MSYFITNKSLFSGASCKVADQIADIIVDYALSLDSSARIDCRCIWEKNTITIAGFISSSIASQIPYAGVAQQVLNFVGYGDAGITYNIAMTEYPADVLAGIKPDVPAFQGIAVGYADNSSPNFLPIGQKLANDISVIMFSNYSNHKTKWMRPDGECQITLLHDDEGNNTVSGLTILTQHSDKFEFADIISDITNICNIALSDIKINSDVKYYINPTGTFTSGGTSRSVGVSGINCASDLYGNYCTVGESPIGKDPSYVGRFGNYYARYVAKNFVAAGICDRMEITLTYTPTITTPTFITFDCFGTEKVQLDKINKAINGLFNYNSIDIIKQFNLREIKYLNYSCFGQMGREELDSPWEKLDKVNILKEYFKEEK